MSAGVIAASYLASVDAYSAEVLADSPLVYWKLNETSGLVASDSSGAARDGAYAAGVAHTGAELVTGLGVSARMTNDLISIADATWMDLTSWTAEIWFTATESTAGRGLACRDGGGGARHWDIHLNEGATGRVDVRGWTADTASQVVSTANTWNDGARHHVVATYDTATLRLYIDATQQGSGLSVAGLNSNVTSSIQVGSHVGSAGVTGDLAAFAYYGTALSGARVSAHYAAA